MSSMKGLLVVSKNLPRRFLMRRFVPTHDNYVRILARRSLSGKHEGYSGRKLPAKAEHPQPFGTGGRGQRALSAAWLNPGS